MYRWHAISFLLCAEDSIVGYRLKHESDPTPQQTVPIVHLICHAIEMLLKLALYKTGSNDNRLRKFERRHNLLQLMRECEISGVEFSSEISTMIESLSPLHEDHTLRYSAFEKGPFQLPFNPVEMIELAKKLLTAAHPSQCAK